jgi:hypothetical protein
MSLMMNKYALKGLAKICAPFILGGILAYLYNEHIAIYTPSFWVWIIFPFVVLFLLVMLSAITVVILGLGEKSGK